MGALAQEERELILAHLRESSSAFLNAINHLSPEQWAWKPAADVWSIAEIADHVVAVEQRLRLGIRQSLRSTPADPIKGEEIRGKFKLLLKAVPDRSRRVKVPDPIPSTGSAGSPLELSTAFTENRAKTMEYVESTQDEVHDHFFPHFVFGDLSCAHWLLLIALHTARHVQQIDEVKASPGYPAAAAHA